MSTVDEEQVARSLAVDEGARSSVALLVGWFACHVVVWIGLVLVVPGGDGVDYDDLGALGTPWVRQFIIPLIVVLTLQLVALRRLGWWRSVWTEPWRSTRLLLWVPPLYAVLAAVSIFSSDGLAVDAGAAYLAGCAISMMLVGFTEELTFRGVLQVGGRRVFAREWQAVLFASVLFGLFHTPNILLGSEVSAALGQTVKTAIIGAALYSLRRASGSLVPCVVLHAVFDFMLIQGQWQ